MDRRCRRTGCDGVATFDSGTASTVGDQPRRRHATCPACGAEHYLPVEMEAVTEIERDIVEALGL